MFCIGKAVQRKKALAMRTMMGTRVPMTGRGVEVPKTSLDNATLNTGSNVFTVCVKLIATAAKDRLAAMWPTACMAAGPAIFWNSAFVMGCSMNMCRCQSKLCQPIYIDKLDGLAKHFWI